MTIMEKINAKLIHLAGGAGIDVLLGNDGDDVLVGGTNNDQLHGGAGNDTYIYNVGDGVDQLYDDFITPGANTLRFGAGVDKNNIILRKGSLLLDLGNGDKVHIEGFNSQDVFNSSSISSFEFADGGGRMRRRSSAATFNWGKAANDESANAWRAAA